jgi:hypothetical protein
MPHGNVLFLLSGWRLGQGLGRKQRRHAQQRQGANSPGHSHKGPHLSWTNIKSEVSILCALLRDAGSCQVLAGFEEVIMLTMIIT